MDSSSNEDLSDGIKRSSAPPTASHEKKRDSKSFLEEELQGGATATVGAVKEMQGVLRKSFESEFIWWFIFIFVSMVIFYCCHGDFF